MEGYRKEFPQWDVVAKYDIPSRMMIIRANNDEIAANKRMYSSFLNQFGNDICIICTGRGKRVVLHASSFYLLHVTDKLRETVLAIRTEPSARIALDYHQYSENIIKAAFQLIYMKETRLNPEDVNMFLNFLFSEWGLLTLKEYAALVEKTIDDITVVSIADILARIREDHPYQRDFPKQITVEEKNTTSNNATTGNKGS